MRIHYGRESFSRFSDEQLERASKIDLVDMLQKQGEKLKREGVVYRWMRYDSTVLCENKWYRHSREVGGGPIQFMQHFYGMSFRDSVKHLLDGEEGHEFIQAEHSVREKPEFKVPPLSKNMHRTFAYLIKTRGIDAEVVQHFVGEKKIQETEEYHNVAFCGYDKNGEMKQMHLRSTIPGNRFFQDIDGSDKQFYFRHEGTDNEVYVFEAPIDMLSYITMNKEGWKEHTYVCLGGVAADALRNVLDNNADISKVYLCVDKDEAGDKTVRRISPELDERGVEYERLLPEGKDWNEDLLETIRNEQEETREISM